MNNIDNHRTYEPWQKLLVFVGVYGAGVLLGIIISSIILVFGLGAIDWEVFANNPSKYPEKRNILLISQGASALFSFLVPTFVYKSIVKDEKVTRLLSNYKSSGLLFLIAVILILLVLPIIAISYQWNMKINLPESLQAMEESAKIMTEYMVNVSSLSEIIISFLVISVIAALTEEIAFRGVLQRIFIDLFRNHHLGILLTGIIFSAIHMQFLGFLPRMLLGVLFGYIYYWSKSLWVPIIMHFINNGLTLLIEILKKNGSISQEFDEQTTIPFEVVLFSIIVCSVLIYLFIKHAKAYHVRLATDTKNGKRLSGSDD